VVQVMEPLMGRLQPKAPSMLEAQVVMLINLRALTAAVAPALH
jgi:hypothetical protein